jgi:hypothetical protein
MKAVVPETRFRDGDWVIITDGMVTPKPIVDLLSCYELEPVTQLTIEGLLPVKTMLGYYSTGIPLDHHEGARRTVSIYRIVKSLRTP